MEYLDIYDEHRRWLGYSRPRGASYLPGEYHLIVHVCLMNERGEMLIQQRQPFKHGWSNFWDVTVGGSAIAGDTSRSAAERETREELGLSLDLSDVRPSLTIHWENGFDDYYLLTREVDIRSLHLQTEEVQAVRWASKEEIFRMIDSGEFIPYEKSLIELIFFRRNHRSSHTRNDPTGD